MATHHSEATWRGPIDKGDGRMRLGSGAFEGGFNFGTRFQGEPGTNPEELIGAAHAGCYAMALSKVLGDAGHTPTEIQSRSDVQLDQVDGGFAITKVTLRATADVPGLDADRFQQLAQQANEACVVSNVLDAPIELEASLKS